MTSIVVLPDSDALATAIATRLVARIAEVQATQGYASIVLTGGTIGVASLAAVLSADGPAVDWSMVDVWWGDERYVEADDEDRNDLQAREALLDHLQLDPSRVHPMPALGTYATLDEAALAYAAELTASAVGLHVPQFDVLMLGMGPEGHVASIFPDSPAAHDERHVFGVENCPKPPPTRISLGFAALQSAREVWMLVSGSGKAEAVATALSGVTQVELPAAGAIGLEETVWLLDEDAASQLPDDLLS